MIPEIKQLRKKDYDKAVSFATVGMNFDCYLDSPLLLKFYGKYFWYLELGRASQIIAAYCGNNLAGVLLADMKNEQKPYKSLYGKIYVKLIDFIQKIFFKNGVSSYDDANEEMYKSFSAKYTSDGEICFLAADPNAKIKGIGSLLLKELEKRESGKRIYLYTDNNCTYQFYEHRGFKRVGEKQIILDLSNKHKVPLCCYMYSKVCNGE